jgi:signal transduction histidine kinase
LKLFSSLTNRIFLAAAAVAVVCIGAAVAVISARVTRYAERELERGLVEAAALVEQHRDTLSESFTLAARLTADQPRLKAAVETSDPPTVQPIAADYQARVKADVFVVTDARGRTLAPVGASADPGTVREALAGRETVSFRADARGLMQVVTVPIAIGLSSPEILGTLSLGFVLDHGLARRVGRLTESEIAFALDGRILAATVPEPSWPSLRALLGRQGVSAVGLEGQDYLVLSRSLSPARGESSTGPVVLVLRSRTERLRLLRDIHGALAATGLLAILIATGLSYAVARTVTRPLATITDTMREMATTGDLTRKIALSPGHWEDEDARLLGSTFNTLTESIARFQKGAAQKERLSALGRLSTVVAHEIRNPLMIIKASVRVLREGRAKSAEYREAVADIDEEVARLNRVVNEVLDLARPIPVERAPTDLNAVCARAAQAALSADKEPAIVLHLDPDLPPVSTDAERFRTALVNILANARQAVVDRGPERAPVELETRRAGSRVAVEVRDRGTGIETKDLPHVFDPYFTTRRTGTGLGLAISKNIVEALGGAISVTSRAGEGTTDRIELPLPGAEGAAPPAGVPA